MGVPQIVTALTALAAVVLGPLVSIYVVRRQFAAQVLSTNRQQWINALRDRLSKLIGFISHYSATKATSQLQDEKVLELHKTAYENWAQVVLLINPKEQDHVQLVEQIESLLSFLFSSPLAGNPEEIRSRLAPLIHQSQTVLKREWERVKLGK